METTFQGQLKNAIYYLQRLKMNIASIKHPNTWHESIDQLQLRLEGIDHNSQEFNFKSLQQALHYLNEQIFLPFNNLIERIHEQSLKITDHIEDIDFHTMQIQYAIEFIPMVLNTDKNCIFCQQENKELWDKLNKFIYKTTIATQENIEKSFHLFNFCIQLGSCYVALGQSKDNTVAKYLNQHLGMVKYLLSKERSRKLSLKQLTNPSLQFTSAIWGILDNNSFIKTFLKSTLINIPCNQIAHIPRLFKAITIETITKEIKENLLYEFNVPKGLEMEDHLIEKLKHNILNKHHKDNRIKVRLLSSRTDIHRKHIDLDSIITQIQKISSSHFQICESQNKAKGTDEPLKNVIFHIHGGGWISMSSFSHQIYTREWAKQLGPNTLIISIDYRLAPEFPFPAALDDCWQVYLWIIYFSQYYLKISLEKVIIAGDSAGGNMGLGICLRALRTGVPLPDGLLLSYPALNLDLGAFTPSLLYSLQDTMSPITILKLLVTTYIQNNQLEPQLNPYLSPGNADLSFFNRLPDKLVILVGSKDVLKDECIKFINKYTMAKSLNQPDPYPKLIIYEGFSHGYLNQGISYVGIQEAKEVNLNSISHLQLLLQ